MSEGVAEAEEISAALKREFYPPDHPKYQGLAEAKGYDQSYSRIEKVRYSHEAMIDMIIADPTIKQGELAQRFGHTQAWISRIIGSDAFQGALAKRREDITDPFLVATIEERLRGLAMRSLDVIAEKLDSIGNAEVALKALDISVKALGFGARERGGANVQNNFVVQIPGKAQSVEEWSRAYSDLAGIEAIKPAKIPQVLENLPLGSTIDRDPLIQPVRTQTAEEASA